MVASLVEATVANAGVLAAVTCSHHSILREIACAALAAVFTITWLHPIDVVKTRIQITKSDKCNTTYASLIRSIASKEGWTSFYRGITVAWIAEAVYYGLQLGLYEPLKQSLASQPSKAGGLSTKLLAAAVSGSFGAITGNPFVVLRTRMVANQGKRRGMASFANDVLRDEGGLLGFYQGFAAMFLRCIVLSAAKMVTYDTCKTFIQDRFLLEGVALQFWSAFVTGFFITGMVMPLDMIRTKMMLPTENHQRTSLVDCAKGIYHHYGLGGFYRGAYAFWVRIAPKTCLQLILFEHLRESNYF